MVLLDKQKAMHRLQSDIDSMNRKEQLEDMFQVRED